jgi:hypothetical protein
MNYPSEIVWGQLVRKIRLGSLENATRVTGLGLEQEADELAAIFSTIITNMERRLARGPEQTRRPRR